MPAARAVRLCPGGVFVRPRMERYVEVSRRIFAIFRDFTPLVEPLSVDEAFLDVTGCRRLFGPAEDIGRAIKDRISDEIGLTASVGVATCKLVAKVASDMRKPDGLVVVAPGDEAAFLAPLPVRRLWGVGPRMEERLAKLGVVTIGDLADIDPARPGLEVFYGIEPRRPEKGVSLVDARTGEFTQPGRTLQACM